MGNNIVSVRSILTREYDHYDQAGSEAVYSVYKVQEEDGPVWLAG